MCDCSSLKCQRCIQKYCCCCCPGIFDHVSSTQSYPHIEYGRIQSQNEEKEKIKSEDIFNTNPEPVTPVPVQKIFQYPQAQRHFLIHPQLDSEEKEPSLPSSVVRHQPRVRGHTELSDSISDSGSGIKETKQSVDTSPYGGSMDDIGAEIEFVDMAKSSVYVESDVTDSRLIPRSYQSSPVPSRARSRSPSPFPSLPSLSNVGTECRKRPLQLVRQSSPKTSCVHFSLYYDENNQRLVVHLKQASRIPTSRPKESSNPFAEVYLLPKKSYVHKSHTETKTHNPVFDETFRFTEVDPHEIRRQTIVVRLYNNERSHFIGGVLYPLESASMNGDLIKVTITEFDEQESLRVREEFRCYNYSLAVNPLH